MLFPYRACSYLGIGIGLEVVAKLHHGETSGVPDLVTELAIAFDAQDVQVDITATGGVGAKGKAQSICTTRRNALGVICFLFTTFVNNRA